MWPVAEVIAGVAYQDRKGHPGRLKVTNDNTSLVARALRCSAIDSGQLGAAATTRKVALV
jgi:hypothetical protein